MTTTHFGEHITIDGYLGDPKKLMDRDLIFYFLNEIVGLLGMRKLSEPQVYKATGGTPKDAGGWSGYVIIEESHVSVHTFPQTRFVSVDVYTCRNGLDTELIINFIKDTFSVTDTEVNFIIRGKRYAEFMNL